MRCNNLRSVFLRYTRPSDDERNVDVFLVGALFSWLKAVLPNVIAVVCCEDEICVVEYAVFFEAITQLSNHLIDSLERTQTIAIPFVVVLDVGLILAGELRDPRSTVRLRDVRTATLTDCGGYIPFQD